jgi:leucyl aminopeptidase
MNLSEVFAARPTKTTIKIRPTTTKELGGQQKKMAASKRNWIKAQGFDGTPGTHIALPGRDGKIDEVLVGIDNTGEPWCFGGLPEQLPSGRYVLDGFTNEDAERAALGWALGSYQFDRYRAVKARPSLVVPKGVDMEEVHRLAKATYMVRDLINTPAGDLGPEELAGAGEALAANHGGKSKVIVGDKLLAAGYPAVHAVGRAASRAPRLLDFTWGDKKAPKLTLVGKGVVFDSGGLDLKPAGGMLLMKKDMGGGAHVLGIASALMDAGVDVRLRVLVPCVENAVSGDAFRPLDVLQTRKGITIEVGNTDAEGRLILSDALHEASTEQPDAIIDFATLTGAARVALGASLPALFCTDDALANDFLDAGEAVGDPLWRMPLHRPYRRLLDSTVADISNIAAGRYGGAITAALFLQEFVGTGIPWAHIDVMAYNQENLPGRPRGGEAMGVRAAYGMLKQRYAPSMD